MNPDQIAPLEATKVHKQIRKQTKFGDEGVGEGGGEVKVKN